MSADFERQKNIQASAITAGIAALLLFIFIWVKLTIPQEEKPPVDDYMEVALPDPPLEDINLGNNDVGSGKVQPIVTGTPSSAPVTSTAGPVRGESHEQTTKDMETDDKSDGAPVVKPTTPNPKAKEITTNANPQTVAKPQPQLRAGAQMTSARGGGNGGNTSAPGYDRPGGQGPGDGPGDKGVYDGNPNGKNYTGIVIRRGLQGRSIIKNPSFNGGNIRGKVFLDIEIDANGTVIDVRRNAGSPITENSAVNLAMEKVKQLKFNSAESNQKGTIIVNFDY
ncbi:MAG: hypothetical protein ACTHMD_13385 [Flavisolibacter sp.]